MSGRASGRTPRVPKIGRRVRIEAPSVSEVESRSSDTPGGTTTAPSPSPSFVETITNPSSLLSASSVPVLAFQPGSVSFDSLPAELQNPVREAAFRRSVSPDRMVDLIIYRLLAGPGNWSGKTVEDGVRFFVSNCLAA